MSSFGLNSSDHEADQYQGVFKNFSHFNFVQSKVFDDVRKKIISLHNYYEPLDPLLKYCVQEFFPLFKNSLELMRGDRLLKKHLLFYHVITDWCSLPHSLIGGINLTR